MKIWRYELEILRTPFPASPSLPETDNDRRLAEMNIQQTQERLNIWGEQGWQLDQFVRLGVKEGEKIDYTMYVFKK